MALFKIYKGTEDQLPKSFHEGYAYFTTDEGNLYIDVAASTDNLTGTRVQVNAGSADNAEFAAFAAALRKEKDDNTVVEIDIEDLVIKSDLTSIDTRVTDLETKTAVLPTTPVTTNAILLGNGNGAFKLVATAKGVFQASAANGAPTFGTAGLDIGGTGATDAASARTNLEVYSKDETYTKTETDNKAKQSAAARYSLTIPADGWQGSGPYTYTYSNTKITCGLANDVPPLIAPEDGTDTTEYNKIDKAIATAGTGITFTAEKKPTAALTLIIVDQAQK